MQEKATGIIDVGGASARRPIWRVTSEARARVGRTARGSWLASLWQRRRPTLYHRCLAVHIHYAGPRSALS